MKKVDIHIMKKFIKAFLLTLVAFLNIFILSQVFRIVKFVTEGKMTVGESLEYILTLIPKMLIDITPLSILLGGLISMNIMASNLEIISLKTSGVSFKRIIFFPVILSLMVSGGVFILSDTIAPKSYEKTRMMRSGEKTVLERPITKNKVFLRDKNNIVYYMKEINRKTGIGENIQIIELNQDFNSIKKILTAEKGQYDFIENMWKLKQVTINYDIQEEKSNKIKGKEKKYEEYLDKKYTSLPEKFIPLGKNPKTLTNNEIKKEMKELVLTGNDIKELSQELSRRYSFPFASFFICFVGLSLGSKYVRGGTTRNIGIAIALGYGYYLLQGIFEAIGKNGYINPYIGNWIPNILVLIIGVYLMYKSEY